MPKQYIYSDQYGREAILVDQTEDGPVERTEVVNTDAIKVGWSKEAGDVSLTILDHDKDPDGFEGRHISLDRGGINALIRTLRKARDDSFGRDE